MSDKIYEVELYSRVKERRRNLKCVEKTAGDYRLLVDQVWLDFLSEKDKTPDKSLAEKKLQEVSELIEIHDLFDYEASDIDIVVTCYFNDENIMNTRMVYAIYDDASGEVQGDYYDYEDVVYDITGYPFLIKLDQERIRKSFDSW